MDKGGLIISFNGCFSDRNTHHLQQGQISHSDVIEGDLGIDPRVVEIKARLPIVDHVYLQHQSFLVHALEELTAEELDTHYGEDEPEDQAHQQHIEDGWDGVHESVDHNPHSLPT